MPMQNMKTKSAFITVIGKPNVGKSSLVNRLVGQKVSIVSYRPQTTRTRITGIRTEGETQLVFLDTPGLFFAKSCLDQKMVQTIHRSIKDVDAALLVVDAASGVVPAEKSLLERCEREGLPVVLAINKIDLIPDKSLIIRQIEAYKDLYPFGAIVPVSALKNDGIERLYGELEKLAEPSVHYFSEDSYTDQSERLLIAEIIREKLLYSLRDEVPHSLAVCVDEMKEKKTAFHIQATIYCDRETHKGIIIGKQGGMLKRISTYAREEIEELMRKKVFLRCFVKVKENWKNSEYLLKSFHDQFD